jgi:hypothetical protein
MTTKVSSHSLVRMTMTNGDGQPRDHTFILCGNKAQAQALEQKKSSLFPKGTIFGHIGADIAPHIVGKSAGDEFDTELRCGMTKIRLNSVEDLPLEALQALQTA